MVCLRCLFFLRCLRRNGWKCRTTRTHSSRAAVVLKLTGTHSPGGEVYRLSLTHPHTVCYSSNATVCYHTFASLYCMLLYATTLLHPYTVCYCMLPHFRTPILYATVCYHTYAPLYCMLLYATTLSHPYTVCYRLSLTHPYTVYTV